MHLLLVEDDHDLSVALERALTAESYVVDSVNTGEGALYLLTQMTFDAVILDLGLPDMDGTAVLKSLRSRHSLLPVLILTARDSVEDRVAGLDAGADDYLTKPFDVPELIARLRAIARRASARPNNSLQVDDIRLDIVGHCLYRGDERIEISGREYALVLSLMENAGRLQTREQLEGKLYAWGEQLSSNAIEVHIHHLRKKLGKDFIKTVRGIGYGVGLS